MKTISLATLFAWLLCYTIPSFAAVIVEGKIPDSYPEGSYRVQDFADAVVQKKVHVIDVRKPGAFDKRHLTESDNKPYAERESWIPELDPTVTYVFICDEGDLAKKIVDMIRSKRPEMSKNVFYLDAEIAFQKNGDIYVEAN